MAHRNSVNFASGEEGDLEFPGGPRLQAIFAFIRWKRLLKLIYGLVTCLVLGEIAIAFINPLQEVLQRDLILQDQQLGFRLVSNYRGRMSNSGIPVRTNSWGLRDREYGAKSEDKFRVYALGDSMVFGFGVKVEDTFPRFLEKDLQEKHGRPVEVINGGVPGYGTMQALELLKTTVDTVKPDLITISIAIFNDIVDNIKFSKGPHLRDRPPGKLQQLRAWLRQRSQLYLMLRRYRASVSGARMMRIHASDPSVETEKGFDLTEQSLASMASIAAERGIGFAVIINPAHKQTSQRRWLGTLEQYALSTDDYARAEPNLRLQQYAESEGIPVLNLLPVFEEGDRSELYFREHWKAPGHRFVAEQISAFLSDHRLIPTR